MYYYGSYGGNTNSGSCCGGNSYPMYGYPMYGSYSGGYGYGAAIILVLFILLVIIIGSRLTVQ